MTEANQNCLENGYKSLSMLMQEKIVPWKQKTQARVKNIPYFKLKWSKFISVFRPTPHPLRPHITMCPFKRVQPPEYQVYPKRHSWRKSKFGIEIALPATGRTHANYSMIFTEVSAQLYNHCFWNSSRLVDFGLASEWLAKQNMKFQVPEECRGVIDSRLKPTKDIGTPDTGSFVELNLLDLYVFHYYSFIFFYFYFYSIQL